MSRDRDVEPLVFTLHFRLRPSGIGGLWGSLWDFTRPGFVIRDTVELELKPKLFRAVQ